MRRGAECLTVIAIVGLLTGCGSSIQSGGRSSPARVTVAQAGKLAAAVNLTSADLPGFTGTPAPSTTASMFGSAQARACIGGVDPARRIAKVNSDRFFRGGGLQIEVVESSVSVWPSASLVATELTAIEHAGKRPCLPAALLGAIVHGSGSSVSYGTPMIAALPTPTGATDGSFGYRIVLPATVSQARLQFYVDVLGFQSGPAGITFVALRSGQPFSGGEEARLYSQLV
ncbi:MAG: hypothetical protein ACYDHH_27045, partial [Solirubrobacteraceae bacterium]